MEKENIFEQINTDFAVEIIRKMSLEFFGTTNYYELELKKVKLLKGYLENRIFSHHSNKSMSMKDFQKMKTVKTSDIPVLDNITAPHVYQALRDLQKEVGVMKKSGGYKMSKSADAKEIKYFTLDDINAHLRMSGIQAVFVYLGIQTPVEYNPSEELVTKNKWEDGKKVGSTEDVVKKSKIYLSVQIELRSLVDNSNIVFNGGTMLEAGVIMEGQKFGMSTSYAVRHLMQGVLMMHDEDKLHEYDTPRLTLVQIEEIEGYIAEGLVKRVDLVKAYKVDDIGLIPKMKFKDIAERCLVRRADKAKELTKSKVVIKEVPETPGVDLNVNKPKAEPQPLSLDPETGEYV